MDINQMNTWEIAIIKVIQSFGGEAELKQIYKKIPDFIQMTEEHLKRNPMYGNRPNYTHQVRSHISDLCQAGELNRKSRGFYILTESGLRRIRNKTNG